MSMGVYQWGINLSGTAIPVYGPKNNNYALQGAQIGTLTKNECCAEGTAFRTGWDGWGGPIYFLNPSGQFVLGMIAASSPDLASFADYASNGTEWVKVSTLKRYVQYDTIAYYADGSKHKDLPAGSYVWLTSTCTRGETHPNFISVSAIQPKGTSKITYSGNGFIDLVHGHYLNKGSILLRQA